jgi:hypothetical protein
MSPEFIPPDLMRERLIAVLTTYAFIADSYHWPGSDGMTVADVLREYPANAHRCHVPDCEELCRRHPELAAMFVDFFARIERSTGESR